MVTRLFILTLVIIFNVPANAQTIEFSFDAHPSYFNRNDRIINDQSSTKIDDNFRSSSYEFLPGVSFLKAHDKTQTNLRLLIKSSSYTWNTFYSPKDYSLSKSIKNYLGFELGKSIRIKLKKIVIMPEVYIGYYGMIHQKYRGYNIFKMGEPDAVFMTFIEERPMEHRLSTGIQNALYYKIHKNLNIGLLLKIAGSVHVVNGRHVRKIIDRYDNYLGNSFKESDHRQTTFRQSSTLGISFRYQMNRR